MSELLGNSPAYWTRNGREIYEGDIVVDKAISDKSFVIEYRIDREYVGFVPKEIGNKGVSRFVSWSNMDVIGNIYENPGLLK